MGFKKVKETLEKMSSVVPIPEGHPLLAKGNYCSFIGHEKYGVAHDFIVVEGHHMLVISLDGNEALDKFVRSFPKEKTVRGHNRKHEVLAWVLYENWPGLEMVSVYDLEEEIYRLL